MKIAGFEIFQFELPLKYPIKIKKSVLQSRTGLILRIDDTFGNSGFGEVSPLPGLHNERFESVKTQLFNIKPRLLNIELPEWEKNQQSQLSFINSEPDLFPSVQFGLESALIQLYSQQMKQPISSLFSKPERNNVPVNGLLMGTEKEIIQRAKQLVQNGFKTLKVKVGRDTLDSELSVIRKLKKTIGEQSVLRLDANRAWSFEEALHFLKNVGAENIEYIEEPLKDVSRLEKIFEKTNFPIALDESLFDIIKTDSYTPQYCKAFILKPTVIGSIQKTIHYIKLAEKFNICPVISDTFQSGLGIFFLASFSSVVSDKNLAMGIDTYNWLQKDILINPLKIICGQLFFKQKNKDAIEINFNKLEYVSI